MKKLSIWALAAALVIGVSACGGQTDTTPAPAPTETETPAPAEPAAETPAEPAAESPMETPAAAPAKATVSAKVVEAGDGLALEVVEATAKDGSAIADLAGVTLSFATPEDSKGIATMPDLKDKTITVVGTVDSGAKTIVVETYEVAATEEAAGGAVQLNEDEFSGFDFSASGSASGKR